ncbi:MAG TPA: metallophosphoesterase [Pirellulales bacterium]|jgi:predicted phosphohydrolase|nr:metallophosphoesterase [Pirellulales bacterium]
MKRIAWLTDIHLNFLLPRQETEFLVSVAELRPDAVLISGDIGEAQNVDVHLERIDATIPAPVYFVLGNHDYYHGSIAEVRKRIARLCVSRPRLHFLTCEGVATLAPDVGLVGHDGWADGRLGDYLGSMVMMHDFRLIAELVDRTKRDRWEVLKGLGDEAAAHFRRFLPLAFDDCQTVVLLTHVPPFREACWHEGRLSDDEWLPHFTCHAVGEAIREIMAARTSQRLIVLCGHTHGMGETRPLPNVEVITGGADYGHPAVARLLEFNSPPGLA